MKDTTFEDFSTELSNVLGKQKAALRNLQDKADEIEKKTQDAENRLRYAVQGYDESVAKNTAYMKEFNEKKSSESKKFEDMKKEAVHALQEAQAKNAQADKLLADAEKKNDAANAKFDEVNKMKAELEIKRQRAKEYAQSL